MIKEKEIKKWSLICFNLHNTMTNGMLLTLEADSSSTNKQTNKEGERERIVNTLSKVGGGKT